MNTHAAPAPPLSLLPPTIAVFPSPEIATETPCVAAPTAPVPTSLLPSCVHTAPFLTYIHAAPLSLLSNGPPTIAVFPSAEIETA